MLVPDVGRDRENAPLLPLEGFFSAFFVPHRSGSLALDDHDRLVKELAAGDGLSPRRHFQNHGVVHDCVGQIDECAVGVSRFPKIHPNLSQVFDKETRVNRNALFFLPT
jgi:hypothetical protein